MTPQRSRGRGHGRPRPHGPKRENVPELHPVDEPPDIASFTEWPLGPDIQRAIAAMDIVKPTPIQALAIGPVLAGRDVIAKAQTGTGKTLAFGAPMMAKIDAARATVLGLVMCPTRELAQQVHGVLATLGFPRGVRVAMCVGGDPIHPQIAELQAGAQVVVGTPGRILDLYQQRFLSFPWTEFVVLDEADKMFEIGFIDDIKKILSFTPEERQTLLFSATFPTEVLKLARESTRDPLEVATAAGTTTVDTVDQCFLKVDEDDKPMTLVRLLEQSGEKDVFLVFCARRTDVDRLMRSLERANLSIKALHGGYDQASRFRVMSAFRTGEVKALIATDVASRGLDVEHVTHVVNFSVPRDAEDYTHRIGRTGRAGRSGTAITFVTQREYRDWQDILVRTKVEATELEPPGRTGARRERPRSEPEGEPRREREARPEREARRDERPPVRNEVRNEPRGGARPAAHEAGARDQRGGERRARVEERPGREERRREPRRGADEGRPARREESRDERHPMHETHARRQTSEPTAPPRPERPSRSDRTGRDERPAAAEQPRAQGSRPRAGEDRGRDRRPARGDARSSQPANAPGQDASRTAQGNRDRPGPRVEGMPVQDRSPEESQRRRRRGRGRAGRPEFDRRDPDGLGRWANRADDFD